MVWNHKFGTKNCVICNKEFTLKSGINKICSKECYKINKNNVRREWVKNNPDKKLAGDARYREKNRERLRKQSNDRYHDPIKRVNMLKTAKKSYLKHINRKKEYGKKYHKEHPEIMLKAHLKLIKKISSQLNLYINDYRYYLQYWSKTVRKRDNNQCQICLSQKDIQSIYNITGIKSNVIHPHNPSLESHHIIHKRNYPQLSMNVNNGITLCKDHHNEAHGKRLF